MLEVKLLGQFDVIRDGERISIPTRNAQSLFAFLILNPGKPQRRERLAGMLWPDSAEDNARSNLRHELWRLRKALNSNNPPFLIIDDLSIAFNPLAQYSLDVLSLERSPSDTASPDDLIQPLSAYRGELLPGFYDEWVFAERQRIQSLFEARITRLLDLLLANARWAEAIEWGTRWIASGGWPEPAFRALITAYASSGDSSKAMATYERYAQALLKEVGVKPSEQTQALYKRLKSGWKSDIKKETPSTLPVLPMMRRSNLPKPLTSFIGREKEIQQMLSLVSQSRLVTITGPGGVGKTRLAIQVAETLKSNFPDGLWWVELAALKGEAPVQRRGTNSAPVENNEFEALDLVAQAAAKALRLPETPGQPLLEDLVENLREKHVMLVLDNCEHLTHASAVLINRLLGECPEVSILVTSREALRIPGERAWILPSLSLPDQADSSDIREIFLSEAVSLFIERTKEVSHNYNPGDLEAAIIAQICTRLDGIPLAIELAAARMNMLSAQEIASRLENRFVLLTGGIRSALPRHRTLQAAIEWSFDLLSDPEKAVFRRLSVFAGGFTLEAGEAVSSDNEICSEEVLTLLGRLVDKSLLTVVPDYTNSGLATRYRFLDTILSFGRIKLEEAGETSTIRIRHAAYYVHLIEITVPELSLRNQGFWYRLLQAESDNIRAVIEWCVETDQAESALILAGALLWFWWSHGSAREGRDLTLKVLALPSSHRYKKYRGRALTTAAYSQWVLGANDSAKNLLEEALSLHKELGDEEGIAWSMQFLGLVFTSEGEYVLAAQAMKEGVAVARKLGDLTKSSFSLAFQGDIALEQGDINKAESIYKESASILRGLGNKLFLAYPLRHLGYLDLERRKFPSALEYFNESLMFNQEGNDQRAITACLVSYAALASHLDKLIDAACICGVVESRLESLSINLLQADQVELRKIQSHLLAKMDTTVFESAFTEGWRMSEAEALQLVEQIALEVAPLPPEFPFPPAES